MFYSALVKFLERHFGILESDVIAKFSELFVPLCLSIFVTVAMYQFIQRNLRREFELARRSCLKLVYAPDKTFSPKANFRQTYLRAINESGSDIPGAQVKIVGARLRKEGSNTWGPTSVIANPNMSWGSPPDGHPNKYSAIQPPPRSEVIDFISSPWTDNSTGTKGFLIRINSQHGGTINPFFWQHGTYKFTMLLSAPNTEPDELTLRVDWDGNDFLIPPRLVRSWNRIRTSEARKRAFQKPAVTHAPPVKFADELPSNTSIGTEASDLKRLIAVKPGVKLPA